MYHKCAGGSGGDLKIDKIITSSSAGGTGSTNLTFYNISEINIASYYVIGYAGGSRGTISIKDYDTGTVLFSDSATDSHKSKSLTFDSQKNIQLIFTGTPAIYSENIVVHSM